MLSFFSKKKIISESPGQPAIPGPVDQNASDDFIFVDRKSSADNPQPPSMYPPMPPMSAFGVSGLPYAQPAKSQVDLVGSISYVHGVPFVLAPQLADDKSSSGVSMEVDRMLALITRQMSVDEALNDYDFKLERSVLNATY